MAHTLESVSDRVLWMRVLDLNSNVIVQAGTPEGEPQFPARRWDRVEKHESLGARVDTHKGTALVVMLPLRMPPPPRPSPQLDSPDSRSGPLDDRHSPYVLEVAISLKAVAASFAGLRYNLILGLIASIALLVSVVVIALRAPRYLRGKYLESELQLAKKVQSDLQPHPQSISPHVEFAACSLAADHVGGDFYDIFEAESGKVAIVLGDVSGKGVPAALLASVLHGAIRSSTAPQHELACERINRMLCERTACERFATLFWGVCDPSTKHLRYVNAGHAAPMLLRQEDKSIERLQEGGPVLGLLPSALYSAGIVKIEDGDKLIVYSDGFIEAANEHEEEFGEARIAEIISRGSNENSESLCERIVKQVASFASAGTPQDDCTLMIVKLSQLDAAVSGLAAGEMGIAAFA